MEPIHIDKDDVLLAARPELAEEPGGGRTMLMLAALAAIVAGGIWFLWQWQSAESIPKNIEVPPVASAPAMPVGPVQEEEPSIQHPVEAPPAEPLPALDESDSALAKAITALVGDKPFGALFIPERLIRHVVATVDNLPREEAPVKVWPVRPVGSWLETTGEGESLTIGPKNAARYGAYVKVVKGLDAQKLAATYRQYYPLFQEAYRDLGYPKGYFNDRLIAAIDNLLATPEATEPLRLVQVKVRYQFADPDLERRSAGQKILLRMGPENARVVKSKLREFRQYVAKRP
ncbi:MAG: DUF3014 domain-containing protein [Rhodocyclales bacterium]|nr:DUF3014 domain-containing protein [Rhodocyclales bacterium]